jgi:hypothetical protein
VRLGDQARMGAPGLSRGPIPGRTYSRPVRGRRLGRAVAPHSGARRIATDPAAPLVALLAASAAAIAGAPVALSWGALGALAGYSLSGSI